MQRKLEERLDGNGNVIYAKFSNGSEYFQEYDDQNRRIYHKAIFPKWEKPYEIWEQYIGNEAFYKDSDDLKIYRKFYENGIVYVEHGNEEFPYWMDKHGNRITK